MRVLYLKIANTIIKVVFHYPNIKNIEEMAQNNLIRSIKKLLMGFILTQRQKKIDYLIHLYPQNIIPQKKSKGNVKSYLLYFYSQKGYIINSHLNLSINQFITIILEIVKENLNKKNGFFFHASGILYNNKILLFAGRSGAGKSTISRLLQNKFPVFIDDTVIISKEDEKYICSQSPNSEKNIKIKRGMKSYELDRIIILHKSDKFVFKKINDPSKAVGMVAKNLLSTSKIRTREMKYILEFISMGYGIYDLWFARDYKKLRSTLKLN